VNSVLLPLVYSQPRRSLHQGFFDSFLRGHEVSYYGGPELLEALPPCGYQLKVWGRFHKITGERIAPISRKASKAYARGSPVHWRPGLENPAAHDFSYSRSALRSLV